MPTRMIATMSSEVPTGRSMKIRDGFMSRPRLLVGLRRPVGAAAAAAVGLTPPLRGAGRSLVALRRLCPLRVGYARRRRGHRRAGCRARVGARPADLGAVAQAVRAVDDDLVADLQAAGDLHSLAVGRAELDDADLDGVVGLDEIDERAGLPAL